MPRCAGFTLLEVLITILVLAFGLLGLASLQASMHLAEVESYQRAQAVLLLQDMGDRLRANGGSAPAYQTGATPAGIDSEMDCSATADTAARDLCEWDGLLKGASEVLDGGNVGAMIGARGCITEIQAADPSPGVCMAGIYEVTVVWQGLNPTAAPPPALVCGQDLYGDERLRRAVSTIVTLGLPRCT